jgi:hypothetical protein
MERDQLYLAPDRCRRKSRTEGYDSDISRMGSTEGMFNVTTMRSMAFQFGGWKFRRPRRLSLLLPARAHRLVINAAARALSLLADLLGDWLAVLVGRASRRLCGVIQVTGWLDLAQRISSCESFFLYGFLSNIYTGRSSGKLGDIETYKATAHRLPQVPQIDL